MARPEAGGASRLTWAQEEQEAPDRQTLLFTRADPEGQARGTTDGSKGGQIAASDVGREDTGLLQGLRASHTAHTLLTHRENEAGSDVAGVSGPQLGHVQAIGSRLHQGSTASLVSEAVAPPAKPDLGCIWEKCSQ